MVERSLSMREVQGSIPCISTFLEGRRTQAVKGVDSKSTGLCPRRFESCRLRLLMRYQTACSWRGSNPRPWAHKTHALTTRPQERGPPIPLLDAAILR